MRKEPPQHYVAAVNRAIAYIEAHASEKIDLEKIAAIALLSKFHFHRIFKSIIGYTVKEYLIRLRVEKAALLLRNSDKSISEIAYACGYTSPETFTRAFKSYFSITPSLFKESSKQVLQQKKTIHTSTSFESLHLNPPKIVEKPDLDVAYIRHFGEYEKVGKSFQKLMIWATKNLVLKLRPTTLGIVHDDPELTAAPHIRFDACLLVSKEIRPKGEIGYKKVRGGKFAVFRYTGSYDSMNRIYDYMYHTCLFTFQWELRDEPTLEWYIKSPIFHRPEDLVTDIYLPIV